MLEFRRNRNCDMLSPKMMFENPEGLKNREKDSKEKPCWRKVYFLDIVTLVSKKW